MTTTEPESATETPAKHCTPDSNRGHYCRRVDGVWTCTICGWTKPRSTP